MLRKIIVHFLMLAMILFLTSTNLLAQQTRITFAKGRTSASVSGKIEADGHKEFSVKLKRNQKVRISVRSDNGKVAIATESCEEKVWSFVNQEPQDYLILICNSGRATNYTITVSAR